MPDSCRSLTGVKILGTTATPHPQSHNTAALRFCHARNVFAKRPGGELSVNTMTVRTDSLAGVRAIAPLLPPGATVGLVTGLAASAVGLSVIQASVMAVVVYSPSVMLTAFGLLEAGAPTIILVATSLIVGVRFMLLSLSISPYLNQLSSTWQWLLAYFLWTPIYALAIERYESKPETDRRWFYLGCALPMWLTFQGTLLIGALFGAAVPDRLQLEFIVPLAFIALVIRLVDDRPSVFAAVVAGTLAVGGSLLPLNTGVIAATVGGTIAGDMYANREER